MNFGLELACRYQLKGLLHNIYKILNKHHNSYESEIFETLLNYAGAYKAFFS